MNIWRTSSVVARRRSPWFRLFAGLFLLLGSAPFLTGCISVDPVVKIGLVAPFEGAQRAIGYDVLYSARLAVRELNNAGGIDGTRVALVALDDRGEADLAAAAAASLAIDPGVVVVVGHWGAETTSAAATHYAAAGLPYLPVFAPETVQYPPADLPADFRERYTAVTPFGEQPGPYAGSAYDAFQLIWEVMGESAHGNEEISRESIGAAWNSIQYDGLTGSFARPSSGDG